MAVGAAGAAAAIAMAIKASGVLVRMDPGEFLNLAGRADRPLIVAATGGLFTKNYQYLMGYKGLAFFTKAPEPLNLPADAEIVAAQGIWIPG
jgi:hypothetical protein